VSPEKVPPSPGVTATIRVQYKWYTNILLQISEMGLVRAFTQQKTRLPNTAIPTNPSLGTSPSIIGADRSASTNRCTFTIYNSGSLPVILGHGTTVAAATQVARLEPTDFYYEEPMACFQGPIAAMAIGGTASVNCEDLIII